MPIERAGFLSVLTGVAFLGCVTPSEPAETRAASGPVVPVVPAPVVQETQENKADPMLRPVAPSTPVVATPSPRATLPGLSAALDHGADPRTLVEPATKLAHDLPADAAAQRLLATILDESGDAAQRLLATILDESGDAAGALLAYRRAAALEFHAPTLRRLAVLEAASGDLGAAVATCELLLTQQPDDPGTHLTLADLYERRGEWPAAEASWRDVLRLQPNVPSTLRRHADALDQLGRAKEARAERAAADRLEREDAEARGADRRLRALPASRR